TTAWLVLRLIEPSAVGVEIPIVPFGRIFEAVETGEVDAALLIHEGRLTYGAPGLHKVGDIGQGGLGRTRPPPSAGVNVIRRGLGAETVARVSGVLRASIRWALANRDEIIDVIAREDRGDKNLSRRELLDEYLKLYANDDTAAMAGDAVRAIGELFA